MAAVLLRHSLFTVKCIKSASHPEGIYPLKAISEDRLFRRMPRAVFACGAAPHPNGTFGYFSRIDVRPQAALPIVQFGGDAVVFVPGL